MITSNNYYRSNIFEAVKAESNAEFRTWFAFERFKIMTSFQEAVYYNCCKIAEDFKGRALYVALSGGADSEFIARTFKRYYIPFTPIIVETPANNIELQYAFRLVRELKINPIVISLKDTDIEEYFMDKIYLRLNSLSINNTYTLLATEKANQLGGIIINGDNLIGDNGKLESDAFEFFADILYKDNVGFYNYTQELAYAMVNEVRRGESPPDFKSRVYRTSWRPKFIPQYSSDMMSRLLLLPKRHEKSETFSLGEPQAWLNKMRLFGDV